MRRIWTRTAVIAILLGATALTASLTFLRGGTTGALESVHVAAKGSDQLVVHEWGTFTNFAGADGIQLEFRPTVDHKLPDFVFNRARQSFSPFIKSEVRAHVRMETPVTYFYSDRPRDVEVKVCFPRGLLTEFYPPVASMGPPLRQGFPAPWKDSFLDWGRVHLIPQALFATTQVASSDGKPQPAQLPPVQGDDHYGYARQTDSNIVETADQFGSRHFEKFLFYRGLGKFQLPVVLEAHPGGRFSLTNFGSDPIPALFLVHIENGRVRFLPAAQLPANGVLYLEEPAIDSTIDTLATELEQALVATGLYEKEAQAMVSTWRSSWFGEDGTRLLYIVPRPLTDAVLPLSVKPAPNELVRVLVGRIEIMTPERESALTTAIREMGTCLSAGCEPIRTELDKLGRFAEPALERIARKSNDESVRVAVAKLLADVRLKPDGQ